MMLDATYLANPALAPAWHLQRAGQWDLALEVLGDRSADLRAEIITERFGWQMGPVDLAAIEAAQPALATILIARLSYFHKLFKAEGGPDVDEAAVFSATPGGWGAFWHGVVQDNVHGNAELAKAEFARAFDLSGDDPYLESFAVRHQGYHLMQEGDRERGIKLLRRSLQLRAALGARAQVAAAQSALASALGPDDPEAIELNAIATATAYELNLVWLKPPVESEQ